MNVYHLSKRLAKVAEYLPLGARFADIGSDHAYLPCSVCLEDSSAYAIAGEVNKGPYESAQQEVVIHRLTERVDVRLGDGLEVINNGEVKQVTIAGMGGPLIRDILEGGKDKLGSVERIIAQPNIDARSLRKWFYKQGYHLLDEEILEENGHIYEVLVAELNTSRQSTPSAKEMWLGPHLLKKGGTVFQKKCHQELEKKNYVISQVEQATVNNEHKIARLEQEIQWLKEVLNQ